MFVKFSELKLPEAVSMGIESAGFIECTPVQAETLPKSLEGQDVAAQAQTGTGKTAAFLISLFSRMLEKPGKGAKNCPRALIIAPTRELVAQIEADAKVLGQFTGFKILSVFGGIDYLKQRDALAAGVDIVVGTPGRLIDYLKQKVYNLRQTEFLVIDEADRMFDMGFIRDLRFLLRRLPPYDKRQSMLFSATLSFRVMELCYEHMNVGEKISLTPETITVERVTQELYHVGKEEKIPLLFGLLQREKPGRTLVFVNTKVMADRLLRTLEANDYKAAALTGDHPQKKRLSMLADFKAGVIPILIATDVASRGLHIEDVSHVFNFDLPQDSEDYVHRIGRTARAGAKGKAISLACEGFVYSLEGIEEYIKQEIPVLPVEDELLVTDLKPPKRHQRKRPDGPMGRRGAGRDHGRRDKDATADGKSSRRRPRRHGKKASGKSPAATKPES